MPKRKANFRSIPRRPRKRSRKTFFNGGSTKPPVNPRPTNLRPWNSMTIQRTASVLNSSTFSLNGTYLLDAVKAQAQIATTSPLEFRVFRVSAHDFAGRPITLEAIDYASIQAGANSQNVVATSYGQPGRNTWARAGCKFPAAISASSMVVPSAGLLTVFARGSVGTPRGVATITSTDVLFTVKLLWRGSATSSAQVYDTVEVSNSVHVDHDSVPNQGYSGRIPINLDSMALSDDL